MFPHPDTVCVLSTMEHRRALAGAARARRAAEVRSSAGPCSVLAGARRRLTRALVVGWSGRRATGAATGSAASAVPVAH